MAIRSNIVSAILLLALCTSAHAQVPSTAQPGRIEQRFQTPPKSQTAPEIEIPGPEAPIPSADAARIHFRLANIVIHDNTVFGGAEFAPLYQSLLGKDVTLAQIFEIRDAITAKYRAAGYVLSQAIIPPQKISDGVVRIKIVEGYIKHVEFQGRTDDARGLIRAMADKITKSRPLNVKVLERYVLLISDIPGIMVRTVIKPSPTVPGAADLVVIIGHEVVSGNAEVDNRGSLAIGPEQAQFEIDLNSLFGLDEQTSILFATTGQPKELLYGQGSSAWLLSTEGLRFTISGSYSDTKPSGAVAALNAVGHTTTAHAAFDYPLIRSRSENLRLAAGFTYLNSTTTLLALPFSDDRLRYFTASATYDAADTFAGDDFPASNIVMVELAQGVHALDASRTNAPDLSRANGRSNFTRLYGEATRIQSLFGGTSLVLSAAGQFAASPLLTPVQFGLGGARFGRGYEPSELTGDDGIAGSAELRYELPFHVPAFLHPQLYAFYDAGEVWNRNAPPGTAPQASLASAGGGIRFDFLSWFSADLELAKPLTSPVASRSNKNVRPLFNISTRF